MDISNEHAIRWVEGLSRVTQPDNIYWCDGSIEEFNYLVNLAERTGEISKVNHPEWPGSYIYSSEPHSVNNEQVDSYICTEVDSDIAEFSNWRKSSEMRQLIDLRLHNSMNDKTMYVVPCMMGSENSPFNKVGIEITDSLYVVINLLMMSTAGDRVWRHLGSSSEFYKGVQISASPVGKGLHAVFPEENSVYSINTTFGGYSFMPKSAWSLTLPNAISNRDKGNFLAAHMMVLGIEDPDGNTRYIAAASQSHSSKSMLASIRPPVGVEEFEGYRCFTVADDISWLHTAPDGSLWAVNPTSGIYSSLKYVSEENRPDLFADIKLDSMFTNVAKNQVDEPWWVGRTEEVPSQLKDWKNNIVLIDEHTNYDAIAPNSRYTKRLNTSSNPDNQIYSTGVPISAIIFITDNPTTDPLIAEANNWDQGIFMGAKINRHINRELVHNPLGILPYLSNSVGDYIDRWIELGENLSKKPLMYTVNWSRVDDLNNPIWPGHRDNFRILHWILGRINGEHELKPSLLGGLPYTKDINLEGLDLETEDLEDNLLDIDINTVRTAHESFKDFLNQLNYVPNEIWLESDRVDGLLD